MRKMVLLITTGLLLAGAMLAVPMRVVASSAGNDIINGADAVNTDGPSINTAIEVAVNTLSLVVGVASVVMVMLGGYRYITSAGDASKANAARSTVLYALIGVVIVAVSQLILQLVVSRANR